MQTVNEAIRSPYTSDANQGNESAVSGASWPAVFAGAFVALAVSLVLLALGSGLGLASISPWAGVGASATTFTVVTAVGLIVVQWLSAGLGGYITGRLRTKWVGVHTHEVFFRDTANGFLMWALATIVGTVLLGSAASSVISGGVHAAGAVASGAAQVAGQAAQSGLSSVVSGYDVDSLFRGEKPGNGADGDVAAQATRILGQGVANGDVPANDRAYLAQMIADRTGIAQADADKRVGEVIDREKAAEQKVKQAADAARKATSEFSIGMALSMLIGAFIACVAAAYGGSLRDEH